MNREPGSVPEAVPEAVPEVPAFTVRSVELRQILLRLKEPFVISSGQMYERRILVAAVRGRRLDGRGAEAVGWGECVAGVRATYSPETVDTAWLACRDWLGPRLVGARFEHPREVFGLLDENLRGHRMAKATLEMACWELAARLADAPLAALLGGTRRQVEAGISMGIQESSEALMAKALAARDRGYRKFKAKIAPGISVDYVADALAGIDGAIPCSVDANAAFHPERDAEVLERLDGLGLAMIEQPLDSEDLLRHSRLQAGFVTDICLDESITGPDRAADAIELGAARIVNIKPGRVGGFAQAIEVHDRCRAAGIPVWCGGMLESGIGRCHNIALASLPNFSFPGDLSPSDRYWERDVVDPPWTMDGEGRVTVPWDRPGPGPEVDLPFLDSITALSLTLREGDGAQPQDGPRNGPEPREESSHG